MTPPVRTWIVPLAAAGLNVAGLLAIVSVEIGLVLAHRVPFPPDTAVAVAFEFLMVVMILSCVGSAVATRRARNGLAAILAGLTIPTALLASCVALGCGLWSAYAAADAPAVAIGFFVSAALFLVSGVVSAFVFVKSCRALGPRRTF
jgi:hypothetical protein